MFRHLQRLFLLVFSSLILGSVASAQTQASQIPGLIGSWSGDGNALDTVNNRSGTFYGGGDYIESRKGKAFGFDGVDDYFQSHTDSRFRFSSNNSITLTAWAFPFPQNTPQAIVGLVSKSERNGDFEWGLYLNSQNRFMATDDVINLHSPREGRPLLISKSIAKPATWYFIAMVYRSGDWLLYVDGKLEATMDSKLATLTGYNYSRPHITEPIGELVIGREPVKYRRGYSYFRGMVDEVKLYNRALTSREIATAAAELALPATIAPPSAPLPPISTLPRPSEIPSRSSPQKQPLAFLNNEIGAREIPLENARGSWNRLAISPDGRFIATARMFPSPQPPISVWDVRTGQRRTFIGTKMEPPASITALEFSPDSKTLAVGHATGTVTLRDVETGDLIHSLEIPRTLGNYLTLSHSPDGQYLAVIDGAKNLRIWDLKAKKVSAQWNAGNSSAYTVRFSPDGKTLATSSLDLNANSITLWSLSGTLLKDFPTEARIFFPVFSPDGKTLSAMNSLGQLCHWNIAEGTQRRELAPDNYRLNSSGIAIYLLRGNAIAITYDRPNQNALQIRDTQTGRVQGELPIHAVNALAASSDGTFLAAINAITNSVVLWEIFPNTPGSKRPSDLTFPSLPGILFHSNRDGNDEIYAMSSDGTTIRRLTNNPANDGGVVAKADGTQLAFTSNRDGNLEIYRINSDGTAESRLTDNPASDIMSSWNRDGRIAFYSNRDGNYNIYTMNEDGDTLVRLTDDRAADIHPAFSPDGRRIAFASNRSGVYEIYVMAANGNDVTRLTSSPMSDREPAWSPDGKKIVWTRREGENNENIYIMNADGTDQKCLTEDNAKDVRATFSADGSKIIFASDRDGSMNIYSMEINGSDVTRLTNNQANSLDPYAGTIRAVAP